MNRLAFVVTLMIPSLLPAETTKWELVRPYDKTTWSIAMRNATDDGFEQLVACRDDRTHCTFVVDANEMRAVLERIIKRETNSELPWPEAKKANWEEANPEKQIKRPKPFDYPSACGQEDCGKDPS